MQAYTIPSINTPVYPFLVLDISNTIPPKCISHSLSFFLQGIKNKIHVYEKEWDSYKKYTNMYEYIHTVSPYKRKPVAKYKPLSRSYFKMIELIHEFQLVPFVTDIIPITGNEVNCILPIRPTGEPIRTFHLAEGPGGFIEAVVNLRKNPMDIYIGMSIEDNTHDGTIPAWNKSNRFLMSNPNVRLENGADGTGNILAISNFEYCYNTYRSTMDFITADGGFDFSPDFNNQELQIVELLFAQIAFALVMQKPGGNFVLKIFDCFYNSTIDLLTLLSSFYQTVYITKPLTSRSGNSEKYVVCKYFLGHYSANDFYPYLYKVFTQIQSSSTQLNTEIEPIISRWHMETPPGLVINRLLPTKSNRYISRLLTISTPMYFKLKFEEYNSWFGFSQIENIHNTICMIERHSKQERIDKLIHANTSKCVEWCIKYNIPYNTFL